MDFRYLNTFVQVAELSSFTRAAERLGYSQPTVSFQIRQLEEELGLKLFDRIGHAIRLTEKGRDVLIHAQRICHACQDLARESERDSEVRGEVRVAMADSLRTALVSSGYAGFREQYPHISVRVATAGTGDLFRMLDQNEADLVCTLDSHIYNTNYVVVGEEQIGVHFIVPAGHPLAAADVLTEADLLEQPVLLTEKGMSYRRMLDERLARDALEIRPVLEISSADLICQLVEQGVGISFLPDFVTEAAVLRGTVKRLSLAEFEPDLWKQLLYHRDKWVSPQMEAVLHVLEKILLNGQQNAEN